MIKRSPMSELDFALDGLYAAGWWPGESDQCLQSADQRWYPSPEMVRASFCRSGIEIREQSNATDLHVSLTWEIPGHGWEAVTARSEAVALLLAYTHLYQTEARDAQAAIGS